MNIIKRIGWRFVLHESSEWIVVLLVLFCLITGAYWLGFMTLPYELASQCLTLGLLVCFVLTVSVDAIEAIWKARKRDR